jgi:hypothetical protein
VYVSENKKVALENKSLFFNHWLYAYFSFSYFVVGKNSGGNLVIVIAS